MQLSQNDDQLPWVVALTGGIGSGKSTVANLLKEKGLHIIDADVLAREVVLAGSPGLTEIVKEFGPGILSEDKTLNRSALGKIVFSDSRKRKKLESILHPKIRELFREKLKKAPLGPVIYVVPLYFEAKDPIREVKKVIVVYSNSETSTARIVNRDNLSEDEAKKRVESQLSIEDKRAKADYTIENTGSLESLNKSVDEAHSWIKSEYDRWKSRSFGASS